MISRRNSFVDRRLSALTYGVALVAMLAVGGCSDCSDPTPVEELTISCTPHPTWSSKGVDWGYSAAGAMAGQISLLLDTSQPMGGFLPPDANQNPLGFSSMVKSLPGHLTNGLNAGEVSIQWYSVSRQIERIAHERIDRLDRAVFNGSDTRLDKAIEQITADIGGGGAELAVLITDLVATGEITGAMGAGSSLANWVGSPAVREGKLDFGVLGVRSPYWGIRRSGCQGPAGLGCWFSERSKRWMRLNEVVAAPVYFLVFGQGDGRVDAIGEALSRVASEWGLDARWELLTSASRPLTAVSLVGNAQKLDGSSPQYSLMQCENGWQRCLTGDPMVLVFSPPEKAGFSIVDVQPSWAAVNGQVQNGGLVLQLDCSAVYSAWPANDLELELTASPSEGHEEPWADWSSETDELESSLDRTLQLSQFMSTVRLRPDGYELRCAPVLHGASDGSS